MVGFGGSDVYVNRRWNKPESSSSDAVLLP